MSDAPLPAEVARIQERVGAALDEVVSEQSARIRAVHPDLAGLADELDGFVLARGKRLRPVLVWLGYEVAGGDDPDAVRGPALAVEFVHTCALVHDDVIDRAPTRRGRATAHVALARRWPSEGGAAEHFGVAAAILLGDLAHVVADDLFLDTSVRRDRLLDAFRTFSTMRVEVTAGQYLDVLAAGRDDIDPDRALTIAGYKSGRYSVARPLEIGARLAGDRRVAGGLAEAGVALGQAFQLRDDVLGVFGTEDETGKSTRSDLAEGKRTYLVAATLERLDPQDRTRFLRLLGDPELDEQGAEVLRGYMRSCGGLAATEDRIATLVESGLAELERLGLPERGARTLRDLARYLASRAR